MKNKSIVVRCSYSDTGPALEELVRDSFRVYLKRSCRAKEDTGAHKRRMLLGKDPGRVRMHVSGDK